MLVVTADDFGAMPSATDPILAAFEAGGITRTSAMVFMRDTDRAAKLARGAGLPVGLHLNLTLAYSGDAIPPRARARQLSFIDRFGKDGWRTGAATLDAKERWVLGSVVRDQLDAFLEAFDAEPSHLDGHHHVHVHEPLLDLLPPDYPVRPVLTVPSRAGQRQERRTREINKRFGGPAVALDIRNVHPDLGGEGLEVLEIARSTDLELMTHPQNADELAVLRSAPWRETIARLAR